MTKQEIIENGTDSYTSVVYTVEQYKLGNCPMSSVEACVRNAMDEYAKQQVIDIAKWLEHWVDMKEGDKWHLFCADEPVLTEELPRYYLEYLKSEK
jgi:hypothetical protein